jgi:glycosyltransferase involved in cell wall biosynthesis
MGQYNNNEILISFIIPTKNEEKNIQRCINSIQRQSFLNFKYEIIVIDNGSKDNTVELAIKENVIVYTLPNVNVAALRNYGAGKANGIYLAFVDADVELENEWLKYALLAIERKDVGIAGSSPKIPSCGVTWVEKAWNLQISCMPDQYYREWLPSMNMIIKKNIFFMVNGFNEDLIACEDVDFGYRVGRSFKIVNDKRISVIHYGEAKTILQFYRKEFWRGSSNYLGMALHGFKLKELVPIIMSIIVMVAFLCFIMSIVSVSKNYLKLGLFFVLVFPIVKATIISYRCRNFLYFFDLIIIWLIYSLARTASGFRELIHFLEIAVAKIYKII